MFLPSPTLLAGAEREQELERVLCREKPPGDLHSLPYFPLSPALTLKYKIKAATKTPKLCRKSPMTWIKAARTLGLPCSWLALWPCSGLWLCPWPDW